MYRIFHGMAQLPPAAAAPPTIRADLEVGGTGLCGRAPARQDHPALTNRAHLVNLVFAVLIRVSDRWNKKSFSALEQHQIRTLRQKLKLDEQGVSDLDLKPEAQPRRSAASAA